LKGNGFYQWHWHVTFIYNLHRIFLVLSIIWFWFKIAKHFTFKLEKDLCNRHSVTVLVTVKVLCRSAACRYVASYLTTFQICFSINVHLSALWFVLSVAWKLAENFTILWNMKPKRNIIFW
jgi:hypothetical protein